MNEYLFERELDGLAFWKVRNTMTAAVKERLTPLQAKKCRPRVEG